MSGNSKTICFKAILCCKSSVNLGGMHFVLKEKSNDNSLVTAHGKQ
jgi:hypothetical protein